MDYLTVEDCDESLRSLHEQATTILAHAEAEGREITDNEMSQIELIRAAFKRTEKTKKELSDMSSHIPQGRKTEPEPTQGGYAQRPAAMSAARISEPRVQLADYMRAVRNKAITERQGGLLDQGQRRMIEVYNAPTSYGSEGTGADGGFAVPPDVRADILDKLNGEFSILGLVNQIPTPSNSLTLTKNETPSFDNSVGPRVYWTGEASQLTESKPLLENTTLRLNKLSCLVPATEELLEDAPSLDSYLRRTVADKFIAELNDCFLNGSGVGRPLGILNAGATVTVDKQSGQAADTVLFANICDMWARLYAPCAGKAVWLINQDVMPQLFQMLMSGSSNNAPVFLPASGAAGSPYSTLFGRPIIPVQACPTLGDKGDIIIADFSRYICGVKGGGMRTDVSMHLYFDYDVVAYRFILRIGGQPLWRAPITPASGSGNTLSCFVVLAERS